jgi:heptosyltransferase III
VYITGLKEEEDSIRTELPQLFEIKGITNLMGKFSLQELQSFIKQVDGLVASGTGVLHLASAMGKYTVGLFPPIKPIHPGRWGPIGQNASYLVRDMDCNRCKGGGSCECMKSIEVDQVKQRLDKFYSRKFGEKRMALSIS